MFLRTKWGVSASTSTCTYKSFPTYLFAPLLSYAILPH